MALSTDEEVAALLELIVTSLDDDKAEALEVIDLAGKSDIADHMVIASGRSSTHTKAMADHLIFKLKHDGKPALSVAGQGAGDWIAIDAVDVLVHLFRPEVRDFYRLEDMWKGDFERNIAAIEVG